MSERTLYVAQKGAVVPWTIPKRDLEPNEVRVKVHSVGINPIDYKTIDDNLADGAGQGNDFAGTVVEVGSEVKSTKVGDTVAGGVGGGDIDNKEHGSFTDLLSVEEHLLFKFPHKLEAATTDSISSGVPKTFEQAASLGIAADTTVLAFEGHEKPAKSDWLLVYGVTGSLGFVAAQFARNIGYNVIGVSASLPGVSDQLEGVHWLDRKDPEWVSKAREISEDNIVYAFDTICSDASVNEVFSAVSSKAGGTAAYSLPGTGPSEQQRTTNSKVKVIFPLYFLLMQDVKKFGTTALPNETRPKGRAPKLVGQINDQLAQNKLHTLPIKVLHGLEKVNAGLDLGRKGVRGEKIVVDAE